MIPDNQASLVKQAKKYVQTEEKSTKVEILRSVDELGPESRKVFDLWVITYIVLGI